MSTSNSDAIDIPTALPGLEDENEREELLKSAEATDAEEEEEAEDELDIHQPSRKSKRKRALKAVAGLMIFFIVLFATVSWFFGIGMFSEEKPQPINRSAKGETQTPVSEDEKLKMALSMVAARDPSSNIETNGPGSETPTSPVASNSTDAGTELFTMPAGPQDNLLNLNKNAGLVTKGEDGAVSPGNNTKTRLSQKTSGEIQQGVTTTKTESSLDALSAGRSVFFGKERKNASLESNRTITRNREEGSPKVDSGVAAIPFGTLLPIRLTSAVYTFRNSGGFIRMELTRAIEGKGYSYPAGTAVVGTLRRAEASRVFVTVTGLIDPASGQLVKLSGELLGRDGASGIPGRKRKVTGVWSRLLRGLRETGSSIVGSIGSWRTGGTVVITDSMRRVGSDIPGSLNDRGSNSDGFVQVDAGSMGFVQVTGLPEEVAKADTTRQRTETGLTDEELADLFSGSSAEKLRAAMPRMTPEFRRLAEKALENIEGQ